MHELDGMTRRNFSDPASAGWLIVLQLANHSKLTSFATSHQMRVHHAR